ncbi:hypothetical protein [Marinobacter mobilis]|uniref:Uncharacterized protein n=2 Tax=Marinobacter mobilis TaxID=488533 RepID=A0A1H2T7P1_9GAMM|nr:hypothetical protein SAMN04487960_102347 [Marinobacter mobilis]
MSPTMKACSKALLTALINGVLAFALMLLVEFGVSGTLHITEPYLWAGLLVCLVVFVAQFLRQRHLCRACKH